MQKPLALATSAALLITGCQTKSPTWQKVMSTPRVTGDAENRSRVYAAELHRTLREVPHKVVTFRYVSSTRLRDFESVEQTSVLYRDPAHPKEPWWAMDNTRGRPVWVPNAPVAKQVQFFVRRPGEILSVQDYTESSDKLVLPLETESRPDATSRIIPTDEPPGLRVTRQKEEATKARPAPKRRWSLFAPRRVEAAVDDVSHEGSTDAPRGKRGRNENSGLKEERRSRQSAPTRTRRSEEKMDAASQPRPEPPRTSPARKEAATPEAKPVTGEKEAAQSTESTGRKPEATKPADRGKKPPLIHREEGKPEASEPAPLPPAEARRRSWLRRVFGALNPGRLFARG